MTGESGVDQAGAYQLMVAAGVQMTTMVVISTERAVWELGKAEPADPAKLMKPLPHKC